MGKLDIVIFGATGFTGMHLIPYIHKFSKSEKYKFSWGISGRSKEKLKKVLEDIGKKLEADFSNIPTIISNVDDDNSLYQMARQAKLVINCVGPYIFYGERVVDACIKAGTHHIDISGEQQYMEKLDMKNEDARNQGVYIISACGFDSIPSDLGVVYLQENFHGVLNSVTTYLKFWGEHNVDFGPPGNFGTWETIVENVSNSKLIEEMKKEYSNGDLPKFTPILKPKMLPHRPGVVDGWAMPFPGSDRSVIKRTQKYFYEVENKRPVQVDTLYNVGSCSRMVTLNTIAPIYIFLSKFSYGKTLLLNYPERFSFGVFTKKQPTEEAIENALFQITFYGEGWKEKTTDKNKQYTYPCNKKIVTSVKGRNPGYGTTCICLAAAAMTILNEKDKLAGNGRGGVYSPGAAFAKTSLIQILKENGVTFDVLSQTDLSK